MHERRCPVCDGRGRLGLFGQYICYNCDGTGVEPDLWWEEEWEEEENDAEEDELPQSRLADHNHHPPPAPHKAKGV